MLISFWPDPPPPTKRLNRPSVLVLTPEKTLVATVYAVLRRLLADPYVNVFTDLREFIAGGDGEIIQNVIAIWAPANIYKGLVWRTLNDAAQFSPESSIVIFNTSPHRFKDKRIRATVVERRFDVLAKTIEKFLPPHAD